MTLFDNPDSDEVYDVLLFNLAHDVLVRFRNDGSCTLEHFDKHSESIHLTQRSQLLLLDALCHVFQFDSPIAKVVRKSTVHSDPDQDEQPPATLSFNLSDMPSLDNVLLENPRHDTV